MRTLSASLVVFLFASAAHAAEPEPVPTAAPNESWWQPSQPPDPPPRARPKPPPSEESASVKVTVQRSTNVSGTNAPAPENAAPPPIPDKSAEAPARTDPLLDSRFLNGFRIGYAYTANDEKPLSSLGGRSFREAVGTRSPHSFLLGYEIMVRMIGHGWLNVILTTNVVLAGLEQSKVMPSGNALIGFEFANSFQLGVGTHLTPLKGQEAHTIFGAGWTPRVGSFFVPAHAFFIPDVDGNHRVGMMTGVTW
jgi:hypothetical protein